MPPARPPTISKNCENHLKTDMIMTKIREEPGAAWAIGASGPERERGHTVTPVPGWVWAQGDPVSGMGKDGA